LVELVEHGMSQEVRGAGMRSRNLEVYRRGQLLDREAGDLVDRACEYLEQGLDLLDRGGLVQRDTDGRAAELAQVDPPQPGRGQHVVRRTIGNADAQGVEERLSPHLIPEAAQPFGEG